MKGQIWETRPLESWARAKELRAIWQKDIERTDIVVGQGGMFVGDWQYAFPGISVVEDNPVGANMANRNEAFASECRLASEVRGWGREICGYHGNCWGAQWLGHQDDGSVFPYRKFTTPFPCVCDSHIKRGEQARDNAPIPRWTADFTMYLGDYDQEREKEMLEHRSYCGLKMINDIERVFGQKFDDEKMFALCRARDNIKQYQEKIVLLMAAKPAPLSVKDWYSFYTMGGLTRFAPEIMEKFWKDFLDEVQWRVDNKIAAVGNERYRWMEAHPPAWHFLKYYRYMEQYGAVCIGSQYTNYGNVQYEIKPDGTIADRDYPRYDPNMELDTREDAVRFMVGADARAPHHFKIDEYTRPYALNEFAKIYQVNGALFGLWRGGVGCTLTRKEQAMRLRREGYSVMFYEGSQPGDRTDLDEKRFIQALDTWMESQGLRKLTED